MSNITRRRFLALAGLAAPAVVAADAFREARSLRVSNVSLGSGTLRFVHFSDFHYKGDDAYAAHVISEINQLAPQFAVFTGDLVEEKQFAPAALEFIRGIESPVYGAPGNYDMHIGVSFAEFEQAFRKTGGEWLVDRSAVLPEHNLEIYGMGFRGIHGLSAPQAERRLLLNHFPGLSDSIRGYHFDLMLSGHSHGGQVRLPFYGPLILPWGVGRYDRGYYETAAGPLYVNVGIGTHSPPVRFNCPPELTLITI